MQHRITGRTLVVVAWALVVATLLMGAGSKKGGGGDPWSGANGETMTNSTDGTFLFKRDDAGTVTLTAADDTGDADLIIDTAGGGDITIGSTDVGVITFSNTSAINMGTNNTNQVAVTTDGGVVNIDGYVQAKVKFTALASGTLTINTVHLATASAADYDIPSTACDANADRGNWITVIVEDASSTISITVDDTDNVIIVPLLSLGADDELDSVSDANGEGTHITLTCMAVDQWYATSMSYLGVGSMAMAWADGGTAD